MFSVFSYYYLILGDCVKPCRFFRYFQRHLLKLVIVVTFNHYNKSWVYLRSNMTLWYRCQKMKSQWFRLLLWAILHKSIEWRQESFGPFIQNMLNNKKYVIQCAQAVQSTRSYDVTEYNSTQLGFISVCAPESFNFPAVNEQITATLGTLLRTFIFLSCSLLPKKKLHW